MVDSYYETTLALAASAARTADGTGTTFNIDGRRVAYNVVCEFTAKAAAVGDKCDVYVDVLIGSTKWINAIHFTQALGNGTAAATEYAVLLPGSNPATAGDVTVATADLASGKVRSDVFGSSMRARWVVTDAGAHAQSFTFSVTAYAI